MASSDGERGYDQEGRYRQVDDFAEDLTAGGQAHKVQHLGSQRTVRLPKIRQKEQPTSLKEESRRLQVVHESVIIPYRRHRLDQTEKENGDRRHESGLQSWRKASERLKRVSPGAALDDGLTPGNHRRDADPDEYRRRAEDTQETEGKHAVGKNAQSAGNREHEAEKRIGGANAEKAEHEHA